MRKCHRCSVEISCRQKIMMWLLYLLYILPSLIINNYYLVTQIGRGYASVLIHTHPMAVPSVLQEWEQIFQSLSKEEALHLIAVFLNLQVLCYVVYWTVAVLQFCVKYQMIGIKRDSVVSGFSTLCLSLYTGLKKTEREGERERRRKTVSSLHYTKWRKSLCNEVYIYEA